MFVMPGALLVAAPPSPASREPDPMAITTIGQTFTVKTEGS